MENHEQPVGKVLFVDDEKNILKSIQREFLSADFEVFTAQGPHEGLAVLEMEEIDIVVSDYRMPDMDGFEFLKIVKEKYPSAYRVILSGFVEQAVVFKALSTGLAGVYLPKPWDTEVLYGRITHIFHTRSVLRNKAISKLINSIENLPMLPEVYQAFTKALEDDRSNDELAAILNRDVSIATKVLHVANSAFYGAAKNLSLERAIIYIGTTALRQIVLIASLARQAEMDGKQKELLVDISNHSSMVNCAMNELYRLKLNECMPEQYTTIGITHDIGKVILLWHLPERYYSVLSYMEANPGTGFYDAECHLGFGESTHAEIGAFFLDYWNLPESSIETALYHHNPRKGVRHYADILEICNFADRLAEIVAGKQDMSVAEILDAVGSALNPDGLGDIVADLKNSFKK